MAVTSRDLPYERRQVVSLPSVNIKSLAYLVVGVLALLATYVLLSSAIAWGRVAFDDLRYGRPRTFHLSGYVGHGEMADQPTRLIAMNLNRQIVILEIPGSDPTQIRSLPGPYLFGAGEDLTPATMQLADFNADNAPDLIVQVKNEAMVYINRDGNFTLITPEEREQISQQGLQIDQ